MLYPSNLYDRFDLGEFFGVTDRTISRWIKQGFLPQAEAFEFPVRGGQAIKLYNLEECLQSRNKSHRKWMKFCELEMTKHGYPLVQESPLQNLQKS